MDWADVDWLLDAALEEDSARRDVTTRALIGTDRQADAEICAEGEGIICGLALAGRLVSRFDGPIRFTPCVRDGDRVSPGTLIARLSGAAGAILTVERTMLNFLQHLSGVATLTGRFVEKVEGTGARIYDTRKTTPGWRRLEKYAVRCGGGSNHRVSLGDAVLIKDNHLALLEGGEGGAPTVRDAVRKARAANPDLTVEVEVESLEQLEDALAAGPDVVLLDNMAPEQVGEAAELVRQRLGEDARPLLEASGNIDLSNVADYAAAGADRIAVGALTHSAPALALSMGITG